MSVITSVQSLDNRILLWSLKHRNKQRMMRWVKLVSTSGDGYAQVGCVVLLSLLSQHSAAKSLLILFAIERSLYWILKNSLKRRRPQERFPSFKSVIEASDRFSFPSGHTSAAFLLVGALSPLLWAAGLYWMAVILCVWAVSVAASRVILGVHYPTDTLAGATLGLSVVALGI